MRPFGTKNFQISSTDQKLPFWQFFRKGRDDHALIVQPSRIPVRISKILFVLGSFEFLVMPEGKIWERPLFSKVQSGKITVCALSQVVWSVCSSQKTSIMLLMMMLRLRHTCTTIFRVPTSQLQICPPKYLLLPLVTLLIFVGKL